LKSTIIAAELIDGAVAVGVSSNWFIVSLHWLFGQVPES
jgi:hypothetical protein